MKVNKPGFITQVDVQPFYQHDCDKCVYLGSATINTVNVDFYVCDSGLWPTIITRHSDEGSDYESMPAHLICPLSPFASLGLALYVKHLGANSCNYTINGIFWKAGEVILKLERN